MKTEDKAKLEDAAALLELFLEAPPPEPPVDLNDVDEALWTLNQLLQADEDTA